MGLMEIHIGAGLPIIVYPKEDHQPASFTVLNLQVDNIEQAVDSLNSKGVSMEQYEGFEMDAKGISRRRGPGIAWFKDPSGNILAIIEN